MRLRNTWHQSIIWINKNRRFIFFRFRYKIIIKQSDDIPATHTYVRASYDTYIKCHKKHSIRSSLLSRVLTPLIHIMYFIGRWSRAIVFFFFLHFYFFPPSHTHATVLTRGHVLDNLSCLATLNSYLLLNPTLRRWWHALCTARGYESPSS